MAMHPMTNPGPRDVVALVSQSCRGVAEQLEIGLANPEDAVLVHECVEALESLRLAVDTLDGILVRTETMES